MKIEPGNKQIRHIVVDVETTGMSVKGGGRVIEIGAVAVESGIIVAEFGTLINTGAAISYGAWRVHGITEQMLTGQPLPAHIWPGFMEFAENADLVAHNAPFDSTFVRHELNLLNMELPNPWQCTVRLSRRRLPHLSNHRLDTVYRYLFGSLPTGANRHRALDDARMAARIWMKLT